MLFESADVEMLHLEVAENLRDIAALHTEHGMDEMASRLREEAVTLERGEQSPSYIAALDAIAADVTREVYRTGFIQDYPTGLHAVE